MKPEEILAPRAMTEANTTVAVQQFLNELGGVNRKAPAEPMVRGSLERAAAVFLRAQKIRCLAL